MTIEKIDLMDLFNVSRQQAIASNLLYYYSGVCQFGHDDFRYTSNSNCRTCQRIKSRAYGRKNLIKIVENFRKRTYGIDDKGINALTLLQNNKCAICQNQFEDGKREKHIDHDHETKRIRGLLCRNCNTGLGLLKNNINNLETAIKYLRQYNAA